MVELVDGENMFGCWIEINDGVNVCFDFDWINKWWIKYIVIVLVVYFIVFIVWYVIYVFNDINVIKIFRVFRKEYNL